MNPEVMFCPRPECPFFGQTGQGNLVSHGRERPRFKCKACGAAFAATQGTPFYRLKKPPELFTCVTTLLAHGCPPQAIVAAFGLDERTVAAWQARAGQHCEAVHAALVEQGPLDLQHVQADELWVKMVGQRVWMALAIAVPWRLWLTGELSEKRDGDLIRTVVQRVRQAAARLDILVCVDGFASYVTEFCRAFRVPAPREPGARGKAKQILPGGFLLGQAIKQYTGKRVQSVVHRAVCGTLSAIEARVRATGGGQVLNTAYIERLNATFRSRLAPLIRRGRCLARQVPTLRAGMYLVGCSYNFCTPHRSLRQVAADGSGQQWRERTPAMAAGLTDHVWTTEELLRYRVVPKVPKLARWRGKRRKGPLTPARPPGKRGLSPSTV